MAKPTDLPEWASSPQDVNDIVVPSAGRKQTGWHRNAGVPEKPPYQFFNWFQNLVYQWVSWFDSNIDQGVKTSDSPVFSGGFRVPFFGLTASIRTIIGISPGQQYVSNGYHSIGIGGGLYEWDATSALLDDGIAVFQPSAISGTGRWIGVGLDSSNLVERSGISSTRTASQNSAALNNLLEFCFLNGIEELYFAENQSFDVNVRILNLSEVRFVGNTTINGIYRRQIERQILPQFSPISDINPDSHLKELKATKNPVVVIMGDSISTDGPNMVVSSLSMWECIKEALAKKNPEKTFTFYNRAIGGQTWANAYQTASAYPEWYTNPSSNWLTYIEALVPDVLFLAFGMNDSHAFNAAALQGTIDIIKGWVKVPDIIFITTPTPHLGTLYNAGVGFSFSTDQEGRDFCAGFVRSYAKINKYGLIDINRYLVANRDGYDVVSGGLELVAAPSASHYTSIFLATNFSFRGTVSRATWAVGKTLQYVFGFGNKNVITITNASGAFAIIANTDHFPTYYYNPTAVNLPVSDFNLEVTVISDRCYIYIDGTLLAEFAVLRHGGSGYPSVTWADNGSAGPFSMIYFLADRQTTHFKKSITDDDIWGVTDATANTKYPYGGNGVNHYSIMGIERIVRPMVQSANLQVSPNLDIVKSYTISTTFLNANYSTRVANYVRKGNLITVSFHILAEVINAGTAAISFTLPFAASVDSHGVCAVLTGGSYTGGAAHLIIDAGESVATLMKQTGTKVFWSEFSTGFVRIRATISYQVAD
jgi:hypothetical protein